MTDGEVLKAVCCLAGADSDVTVEELQLLAGLAQRAGLERQPFNALVDKTVNDEGFRQQQLDLAMRDVDGTMKELIRTARQDGSLNEGHVVMLLWRVATKLDVSAGHFEKLLGAAQSAG